MTYSGQSGPYRRSGTGQRDRRKGSLTPMDLFLHLDATCELLRQSCKDEEG